MAFSEDDIKISVTVETEEAQKSVDNLKKSFDFIFKEYKAVFKDLSKVSKDFAKAQSDSAKAEARVRTAEIDKSAKIIVASLKSTSDKNIATIKKETEEVKQAEKTKQAAIAKTIADVNLQGQQIRRNIVEIQRESAKIRASGARSSTGGGGIAGGSPEKQAGGFDILTASLGKTIGGIAKLQAQFYVLRQAVSFVTEPIRQFNERIDELARQASELEGLKTGFDTLQRSIGNLPTKAIEDLRKATKGLISDTDLYQRANQAVLLNVPTDTFNEAAAAAVKLGRAMGVDAAFGLESLSIGLGRQSRLYLDNLGIVISAQQAYANFAREVGKSADQLSDAEKRSAFFAEALGKIKERAEELPDLLDSVGIAQEKLRVVQDNVTRAQLEAFNNSQSLRRAYQEQADITERLTETDVALTRIQAELGAALKGTANVFRELYGEVKIATVEFLEFLSVATGGAGLKTDTRLKELPRIIGNVSYELEQATKFAVIFSNVPLVGDFARRNVEALQEKLADLNNELEILLQNQGQVSSVGFQPNIPIDELAQASADIKKVFSDLQESAITGAGLDQVPGLSVEETDAVVQRLVSIQQQFSRTKDLETFKAKVAEVRDELIELSAGQYLQTLYTNLIKVTNEFGVQSKEARQLLANYEAAVEAYTNGTLAQVEGAKAVLKVQAEVSRELKKRETEERNAANKRSQQLKQQENQTKNFFRKIRAASKDAIPRELEERIANLFQNGNVGSEPFIQDLEKLRQQFIDSGKEVKIFDDRILKLAEQFKQGIPIKTGIPELNKELKTTADDLEELKSQSFNIRDTIFGEAKEGEGGAFFGFDVEGVSAGMQAAVAKAIGEIAKIASTLVFESFDSSDAPEIGRQIGQAIGGDIGGIVGEAVGRAVTDLTKDLAGTAERKKIDRFFFDLFKFDRLTILIDDGFDEVTGQIRRRLERITDLTFEGGTLFGGDVDFGGDRFFDFFDTLDAKVQNSFLAFGTSFGLANGIAEEQSRLIGVAILNNIGGSLQDLQILIQATGAEFEQLAQSLLNLFLDAKLSIEEYYQQALALKELFTVGIPGAVGAVDQAIRNLQDSLADGKPGRYAVDSLRDIAAEGLEVSRTFQDVVTELAASYGATAEQTQLFFAALQAAGITSLEQLKTAGENTIISLLFAFQQIKDQAVTTAEEVGSIAIIPEIQAPQVTSSRPSGPDPAKERADALKRLREETYRLLIASRNYASILSRINQEELTNLQGGKEIRKLRQDIFKTLRQVTNLEAKYQEELNKGARASEKRLTRLGKRLDEAQKKLNDLTEAADNTNDSSKKLDLSGIIPLIRDVNKLGVVSAQTGVDLEKNIDILVKGFLQGRLSISEVNAEIEKTKELLGPGIPNAVGAVTDAFQNLIDAGEQGGAFSVDAFTDIFAEFREKFENEGSALREAQRKQLVANLEQAKQAFAQAVGPEATAEARKSLDLAKKALSDFYDEIPAPDLEDLRNSLQAAFSPEQVDLFFRALDESGLKTFGDFEKAGADSVVGILGRLKELGFEFGETSGDIKDINDGLIDAEKNANGGLDPLAEAIDLVRQFNEGASTLPPVFDATTDAITKMADPLLALSDGFDNIIEKLGLLAGQTFENNIVFNVRTVGDSNSQALIDILFGNGSSIGGDVGGEGPGVGGESGGTGSNSRKLQKFLRELEKLKASGRGRSRRASILRRRISTLRSGGSGL